MRRHSAIHSHRDQRFYHIGHLDDECGDNHLDRTVHCAHRGHKYDRDRDRDFRCGHDKVGFGDSVSDGAGTHDHECDRHSKSGERASRQDDPIQLDRIGNGELQSLRYLVRERGNDQLVRTPHRPRDCGERDRDRDLGAGQYKVRHGERYGDASATYHHERDGDLATVQTTGQTSQCTASVQGTGAFNASVTWTASQDTITASGIYTAGMVTTITQVTITATSGQDPTKSGSVTITVNPPPPTFIPIPDITLSALGQKITPVDLSLYVQGGTGPYTLAIKTQTLLDSVVCSIVGTQLVSDYGYYPGTNTITITVTDAAQNSAQTTVNIIVTFLILTDLRKAAR